MEKPPLVLPWWTTGGELVRLIPNQVPAHGPGWLAFQQPVTATVSLSHVLTRNSDFLLKQRRGEAEGRPIATMDGEFDGTGMGVPSDGTPYLNQRGPASLCDVMNIQQYEVDPLL
jgi:hypothetical protein